MPLLELTASNSIITSTLSIVEVLSALNRLVRETRIDTSDYPKIADDFLAISGIEYSFIDFTAEVIDKTKLLLETYPLRAGDAIQLASALLARASVEETNFPSPIFLTSDNKLLDAAIAEGFTTDNPLLHP